MHLRRERSHQTGRSNKDYKIEPLESFSRPGTFDRIESLSQPRGKSFVEVIKTRMAKTARNPLADTMEFYHTAGKKPRKKTEIGYVREAQLEEKEKRKIVFTGESELIYSAQYHFADEAYSPSHVMDKGSDNKNLIQEKHKDNALALQETQLIGMEKYSQNTLKDKVNLEKVREVRRAIRRRYGNRGNIQKIFNLWDEENLGVITLKNVYNMIKKLGLNLNIDEARVLLASADKDFSGDLTLDEFLDLIYNKDDILNVNFDKLTSNIDENFHLGKDEIDHGQILNTLAQDAKNGRDARHRNQINLILKNRLNDMAHYLMDSDPNHQGHINYEKFEACLRKLSINENILKEDDIKHLFQKNKVDEHNTDYKQLIEDLRDFKFVQEDAYRDDLGAGRDKKKAAQPHNNLPLDLRPNQPEELHIVDCRTLPISTLEKYFENSRKVARALMRYFPTKKEFNEHMMKTLKIDSDKLENHSINKEELKNLMDNLFSNFDDSHLTQRDFQGFYSTFIYNKHGYTDFKNIAYTIFDETEKEFLKKVQKRTKGPAPNRQIAFEQGEIEAQEQQEATTSAVQDENKEISHEEGLNKTLDNQAKANGVADNDENMKPLQAKAANDHDKNLKTVLKKFEDRIFVGKTKAYDIYKMFDSDHDGYISHKDFIAKITEMCLFDKGEIQTIVKHLDPENKGYVEFAEFSKKLRPNMTQQDENGNQIILPYLAPSKEITQKLSQEMPAIREKINKFKKSYIPSPTTDLHGATRFGASPPWQNTFLTMQAPSNSAMFISESGRFNKNREEFQFIERAKKEAAQLARIEKIKSHNDLIEKKISQQYETDLQKQTNKQKTQFLAKTIYEHVISGGFLAADLIRLCTLVGIRDMGN